MVLLKQCSRHDIVTLKARAGDQECFFCSPAHTLEAIDTTRVDIIRETYSHNRFVRFKKCSPA